MTIQDSKDYGLIWYASIANEHKANHKYTYKIISYIQLDPKKLENIISPCIINNDFVRLWLLKAITRENYILKV